MHCGIQRLSRFQMRKTIPCLFICKTSLRISPTVDWLVGGTQHIWWGEHFWKGPGSFAVSRSSVRFLQKIWRPGGWNLWKTSVDAGGAVLPLLQEVLSLLGTLWVRLGHPSLLLPEGLGLPEQKHTRGVKTRPSAPWYRCVHMNTPSTAPQLLPLRFHAKHG